MIKTEEIILHGEQQQNISMKWILFIGNLNRQLNRTKEKTNHKCVQCTLYSTFNEYINVGLRIQKKNIKNLLIEIDE